MGKYGYPSGEEQIFYGDFNIGSGKNMVDEYLNQNRKLPRAIVAANDFMAIGVVEQLSKGNQQKVQLMSALIGDPKLVVLDEPMSGLDPVNMNLFRDVIREEAKKDKYIIMSSHQMGTIEEFCSDITILTRGKTILSGNINEIKKSYGRINLVLKADADLHPYIERYSTRIC